MLCLPSLVYHPMCQNDTPLGMKAVACGNILTYQRGRPTHNLLPQRQGRGWNEEGQREAELLLGFLPFGALPSLVCKDTAPRMESSCGRLSPARSKFTLPRMHRVRRPYN